MKIEHIEDDEDEDEDGAAAANEALGFRIIGLTAARVHRISS